MTLYIIPGGKMHVYAAGFFALIGAFAYMCKNIQEIRAQK